MGTTHFKTRRVDNVAAEMSLHVLAYNLKRAIAVVGAHRLSPWLSHLMVSRQETARALLTPGEIMQLPAHEAIIFAGGAPPIRALKIRYYADPVLARRVRNLDPDRARFRSGAASPWTAVLAPASGAATRKAAEMDEGGLKQEPELAGHDHSHATQHAEEPAQESDSDGDEIQQGGELQRRLSGAARQAAMDPDDGIPLGDDL